MEQRTTEWFLARKGKFTASEIHNLLIASRKKDETFGETAMAYIKEKVAEYVMSDDVFIDAQDMAFSNAATRWGTLYEAEARAIYSDMTGITVEETGFVPYSRHSGGSPDGLTGDGGLIEIKCPFNPSRHVDFLLMSGGDDLKALSRQYYYQVQANMLFTGRTYADFISYDPRMSDLLKMKILRVEPDKEAFALLEERIGMAEERMERMVSEITRIGINQVKKFKKVA